MFLLSLFSWKILFVSTDKKRPDSSDARVASCFDSLQKAQEETEQKHLVSKSGDDLTEIQGVQRHGCSKNRKIGNSGLRK